MNYIEKIRTELKNDFNNYINHKIDINTVVMSPSYQFRLEFSEYSFKAKNISNVVKVEIYNHFTNELIFDFLINYTRFFYGWVNSNDNEYLICAEDIYGGQTVIDLTNQKMEGYSPNKEGFIWTEFHLSPDGTKLATIGCYWACPYDLKIYDFRNPLTLPLKEIYESELRGNEEIVAWIDNETLQLKGSENKIPFEYEVKVNISET